MTDVVSVGSPIEGGMHVDLDEVRATPRADQWKHTDLLCGLIDHLRTELERTTGDLATACEVARERGLEVAAADAELRAGRALAAAVHDYMTSGSEADIDLGYSSMDEAMEEYAAVTDGQPRTVSATNPDGFVAAQIAETTGLLRSLWCAHHIDVMKLGGPVVDPVATFEAWLTAVRGGGQL